MLEEYNMLATEELDNIYKTINDYAWYIQHKDITYNYKRNLGIILKLQELQNSNIEQRYVVASSYLPQLDYQGKSKVRKR